MQHKNHWPAALAVLAMAGVSGCARSSAFDSAPAGDEAVAKVESIHGSNLARVILSARAAQRIGIRTAVVGRAAARHGGRRELSIPYAAVLYDAQGRTFAYASSSRLTYVRRPIAVERITGRVAILSGGPPPGTSVVTVGAAELLGTEYGVEG
jgi:hypothetical protein